jgi:hypothetical protein
MFCKNACFSKGYRPTYVYEHCHTVTRSTVRYVTGGAISENLAPPPVVERWATYRMSHITWNPPRKHATAATGNEPVAMRNIHRMLVCGFQVTWDTVQFSDIINCPVHFDGFDMYGCFCDFSPENGGRMFLVNKALLHIRPKSEGQHRHVHSCWEPKISLKTLSPKVSSTTSRIQVGYEIWKTENCEGKIRGFQM